MKQCRIACKTQLFVYLTPTRSELLTVFRVDPNGQGCCSLGLDPNSLLNPGQMVLLTAR